MAEGKLTQSIEKYFKPSFYKTSNPHLRIFSYATTSTDDSVYIIGGYISSSSPSSTIAKYSGGSWTKTGSLKQARLGHGAITLEGITMIIGGWVDTYQDGSRSP